jgi:hypothetical protein
VLLCCWRELQWLAAGCWQWPAVSTQQDNGKVLNFLQLTVQRQQLICLTNPTLLLLLLLLLFPLLFL